MGRMGEAASGRVKTEFHSAARREQINGSGLFAVGAATRGRPIGYPLPRAGAGQATRTNPPTVLRVQVLKELEDQGGVRMQADHWAPREKLLDPCKGVALVLVVPERPVELGLHIAV